MKDVRAGLELAREHGDLSTVAIGYSNLGSVLFIVSAHESDEVYREGIEFSLSRGLTAAVRWQRAERTRLMYELGEWDEVIKSVDAVLDEGEHGAYATTMALSQKALVLLNRGRVDKASELVDDVLPRARCVGDLQALLPALNAAAAVAAAKSDVPPAIGFVREVLDVAQEAKISRSYYLPEPVAIAVAAGEFDIAEMLLDGGWVPDSGRAAHAFIAARAVRDEGAGDLDKALALYDDAAGRWSEYGYVFGRGNALFGAGRCLLELGRPHEAMARLREARELFQQLEATPSVTRVDEALARATSISA